jgi:hypothetical protein
VATQSRYPIECARLGDLHAAAAATPTDQARYLAAGEALLTRHHGAAWYASMLLNGISTLLFATVMRRHSGYGRVIGTIGVVTAIPAVGVALLFLSMLGWLVWLPWVARSFWLLGRTDHDPAQGQQPFPPAPGQTRPAAPHRRRCLHSSQGQLPLGRKLCHCRALYSSLALTCGQQLHF